MVLVVKIWKPIKKMTFLNSHQFASKLLLRKLILPIAKKLHVLIFQFSFTFSAHKCRNPIRTRVKLTEGSNLVRVDLSENRYSNQHNYFYYLPAVQQAHFSHQWSLSVALFISLVGDTIKSRIFARKYPTNLCAHHTNKFNFRHSLLLLLLLSGIDSVVDFLVKNKISV